MEGSVQSLIEVKLNDIPVSPVSSELMILSWKVIKPSVMTSSS